MEIRICKDCGAELTAEELRDIQNRCTACDRFQFAWTKAHASGAPDKTLAELLQPLCNEDETTLHW